MEYVAGLLREAIRTNERRLLVLTGTQTACADLAAGLFDRPDLDPAAAVAVGTDALPCEAIPADRTAGLMGTTQQAVVVDCHERCEPNTLGRAVGAVDGGGLLVLLAPPLDAWPDRRDAFDDSLAVPPFDRSAVDGIFRERLVETLRTHPGIAIVDADDERVVRDGHTDPAPRLAAERPDPPADSAFPVAAYEACLTGDQQDALGALERLRDDSQAVVVEADRGRGKSSVAGLAASCLAAEGSDVLVTAPGHRNAEALFERAAELLAELGALDETTGDPPTRLDTEAGQVRFCEPTAAASRPGDPDHVVVDEAAAVPVGLLDALLGADSHAFVTTVHGYEGAGRGFSLRFRDRLDDSPYDVTEVSLTEPVRYGPADPVEVWSFRALCLDASPVPDQVLLDRPTPVTPETVTYRRLSARELLADDHLLREVVGLLVAAHYQTEPNDVARLLDAPNVTVHGLLADGHVAAVAMVAREGGLSPELRERVFAGERVRGNLIPDLLTSQLRDPDAGEPVGDRVVRIATHGAVRSRGLGSRLLDEIAGDARARDHDWVGVGYGATPRLVEFWRANGYRAVHLGTTRNDRSGDHSVVMLVPLSPAGRALADRHTEWFARRLPSTLSNALSSLDPDVVRAVCRAVASPPAMSLTEQERRIVEEIPDGTALYDTAPRPVTMLTVQYLVDGDARLSADQERLLVRKALQAAPWGTVAEELDFVSPSACKRALGDAVAELLAWRNEREDR